MNPWIECFFPNSKAAARLFCFPYAGAGSLLYRSWSELLPSFLELCPIVLPGRERRFQEPFTLQLNSLVQTLADSFSPFFDKPFLFFGHSLGALIAFELSREFRRREYPLPSLLIVSGCTAPQMQKIYHQNNPKGFAHTLSDEQLVNRLKEMKGTPSEILDNPRMIKFFLPILKADLEIAETYEYKEEQALSIPILALGGDQDPEVSIDFLQAWNSQTVSNFKCQIFPGNHFYLNDLKKTLLEKISEEIRFIFPQ